MGFSLAWLDPRASMGDAPLAAASCAAHDTNTGAIATMRSRVNRAEGPATLMVPIDN